MPMAATATPAPAPTTSTVSSARSRARVVSIRHAVRNVSGNAAASSHESAFGLAKNVAGIDVDQLARGPIRVLAEDAKAGALDVLAGPAPLALPAAEGREDDDLVAGLPGRIGGGVDHAGAVGGDDPWRRDALRAVGEPEVQVVDRRRLDRDRHGAGLGLGSGPLANAHAGRAGRLLVNRGAPLAQDLDQFGRTRPICES